jgi:hypothetical protein
LILVFLRKISEIIYLLYSGIFIQESIRNRPIFWRLIFRKISINVIYYPELLRKLLGNLSGIIKELHRNNSEIIIKLYYINKNLINK